MNSRWFETTSLEGPDPMLDRLFGEDAMGLDGNAYYVFVESIEFIARGRGVDGPHGGALDARTQRGLGIVFPCRRFRLSGLSALAFRTLASTIDPIRTNPPTDEARQVRGRQLETALAVPRIPVIDVYAHDTQPWSETLSGAFVPGTWLQMSMRLLSERGARRRNKEADSSLPIAVVGAPEFDEPPFAVRIERIGSLSLRVAMQLRDIFSLAHVPDATLGYDERGGGEGKAIPPAVTPNREGAAKPYRVRRNEKLDDPATEAHQADFVARTG